MLITLLWTWTQVSFYQRSLYVLGFRTSQLAGEPWTPLGVWCGHMLMCSALASAGPGRALSRATSSALLEGGPSLRKLTWCPPEAATPRSASSPCDCTNELNPAKEASLGGHQCHQPAAELKGCLSRARGLWPCRRSSFMHAPGAPKMLQGQGVG